MRKMKHLYVVILLIYCSFCIAQNGTISGNLTFEDGRPVSYAVVYIQKAKKYAVSDDDGKFVLTEIPYGNHLVAVQTIEAEDKEVSVEVNASSINLSIVLKENANLQLEDVVVWGKSEARKLKDQGFAIGLIEMDKASLQSVQTADLLDRAAGVRIRQSGGMGSEMQFNINGMTGNSVRVFIDGIPIRNYGSSFSLTTIPPDLIERVEVYKGVVPTHLSEDALGGAINVILKKSVLKTLSTSYSYGSFNTHQWNMHGNYRHDKTGFTFGGSAMYNYSDNNYKIWGDQVYTVDPESGQMEYITAKRFHDSYRSMGLTAEAGFTNVKWADRFMVGMILSNMKKDMQHGATMEVPYGNRHSVTSSTMFNLKYEKKDIIKNLSGGFFIDYSNALRTVVDTIPYIYNWKGEVLTDKDGNPYKWGKGGGEADAATNAENREKMFAGKGNLSYRLNEHNKVSVNYLYNRFTRNTDDPYWIEIERELSDTRYVTKGILGVSYDNNLINDRLKSSLFYKYYMQEVKLNDFKKVDGEIVPDIYEGSTRYSGFGGAFSFALLPEFLILISAEKAIRLPEINEVLGNTSQNLLASYDLLPERSMNLNLGFNIGTYNFKKHMIGVDVNFFYRDISDMIKRITGQETSYFTNYSKVLSKGVDVELRYNYNDKIILTSNLSSFNTRYNQKYDKNGNLQSLYRKRVSNSPYFTWNNMASYLLRNVFQKGSHLTLNYYFNHVHEFFRHDELYGGAGKAVIPTQSIHDFGVVYTFPHNKLSLSFDARNFTNEQVFDNWALQKPGRAFYAKVSYRIF